MLKLIVAYDKNMLIGNKNTMPWYIKEELEHFKFETIDKILVMGERTFLSLDNLPKGKEIIVLSKNKLLENNKNVKIESSIESIINRSKIDDIYILGGRIIYEQFLPFIDLMIISKIDKEYIGDIFFPKWNENDFTLEKTKVINNFITVFYYKKIKK